MKLYARNGLIKVKCQIQLIFAIEEWIKLFGRNEFVINTPGSGLYRFVEVKII